ncbi:unnamed protein product [Angiostrongylus costaricensis]|uniref:Gelsolin repeat protein n=1 Tax=Angiostrongylus costaricensis TaxID=334426 RepID=A0A158PHX2_ANGCS|nr:unnamed protein product [Angiostrongylus costaricensis]
MPSEAIDLSKVGKKEGLEIWRVNSFSTLTVILLKKSLFIVPGASRTQKFKLEPVLKTQYGEFYTGDAYVCLHSKNRDEWHIHFWIGEEATTDEMGTAAITTVEIDQALNGLPVQHREIQNHESSLFLSYFPNGIRYLKGGYESGYRHVEDMYKNWKPKLFHCKGKRNVRCIQIDLNVESLNLGDVFILDMGKDIYVWMPPDSGRLERIKARTSNGMSIAKDIALSERQGRCNVHIIDSDWDKNEEFFSHFGGTKVTDFAIYAKAWPAFLLCRVSDALGTTKVTKVPQVKQKELNTNDAFILDTVNGGIFVWIGKNCTLGERCNAILWGEKYLKEKAPLFQKLPSWSQITTVFEGSEPSTFTQWFAQWVDAKEKKAFKPRLFQVSDSNGRLVVEEIENFDQESLDGDDVMIVDALSSIFVWVGAGASLNEKEGALSTAKVLTHSCISFETALSSI